jgi:penicillin-binding protein 2
MSMPAPTRRQPRTVLIVLLVALAACQTAVPPEPSASPEGVELSNAQARDAVVRFLSPWRTRNYDLMHARIGEFDRRRYTLPSFSSLHRSFDDLTGVERLEVAIGSIRQIARPPEPRAVGGPIVPGPVPGVAFPVTLHFETSVFGDVDLDRVVELTPGAEGWEIRWRPAFFFPELDEGGTFSRTQTDPSRGRILAVDGTVLAETRADGMRVYPQDSLAGQTVGTVRRLDDAGAADLAAAFYRAGQWIGRSGVEAGAEGLLRGYPGFTLLAAPHGGSAEPVLERALQPGADVTLTIDPYLQRQAERLLAGHDEAATAVVDPRTGDVWALASMPALNPNAMTIGTTMSGVPLRSPTRSQLLNHAVEVAYPSGSSFKPFTLAAALQQDVASPATRMPCAPTWEYRGFTFHNYLDHSLPGLVDLKQAMAFSCNTTYMPLSIMVYEHDRTALTEVVADFGFGQNTGIGFISETPGVLPDRAYFEATPRWDGRYIPYNGFDQIQLAIGQGSFLGTQLQLAMAYAAFGNGGILFQPRLVTGAALPDGTSVLTTRPTVRHQVAVGSDDLSYLISALEAVTQSSVGTATAAFAGFGVSVAGKSGTAETGTPNPHALFPAFAPSRDPEIVVATILAFVEIGTGGSRTAPLVRQLMGAYFAR